ncbi:DNA polymerase III subunit delta [Bacillaceae bacterium Marseille-Q3522]|nr:DNA polymerase III subunit delta [Bacillaceae bacterium Marseille-Q3522]
MMIDLWKQIKAKQFSPLYLLYGTESYLMNETKQLLIENVLTEEEQEFNYAAYDLEETVIDTAIEDAETIPFIGEKRLIFLHNPSFLTAEKGKDRLEHDIKKLERYLLAPSPFTVLVFFAPYEKLDERKKLTKQLKKSAAVLEAKKLTETELISWIRESAGAHQVSIDDDAAEKLLLLTENNLFLLASEMAKLALYCREEKKINLESVEKLVSRTLQQNIFTLVDKVVQRKIDEAFRIYYDLRKQNEEPIKILALLTSQFRVIYQVKELAGRGYGQKQIAAIIKIHPFRVKLASAQSRYFSEKELAGIIARLAEADYQMKTGGMDKDLLIELFLFHLQERSVK